MLFLFCFLLLDELLFSAANHVTPASAPNHGLSRIIIIRVGIDLVWGHHRRASMFMKYYCVKTLIRLRPTHVKMPNRCCSYLTLIMVLAFLFGSILWPILDITLKSPIPAPFLTFRHMALDPLLQRWPAG